MPRRERELTPRPQNRCWRKYYKGKYHYVGKNLTDENGKSPWDDPRYTGKNTSCRYYLAALAEWRAIKNDIDSEATGDTGFVSIFRAHHLHTFAAQAREGRRDEGPILEAIQQMRHNGVSSSKISKIIAILQSPDETEKKPTPQGKDITQASTAPETSIKGAIDRYLEHRATLVQAGEISAVTWSDHRAKLKTFRQFADRLGVKNLSEITSSLLQNYRDFQLGLTSKTESQETVSKVTVRKRLVELKAFLTWAHSIEILDDMPKLLSNPAYTRIRIEKPTPEFFEIEEVRQLYAAADPLMKACISLACNAGFYSIDIAGLEWEMLDTRKRIISRLRGKTKIPAEHRLWSSTIKLLRRVSQTNTGLILTDTDGAPLAVRELVDSQKGTRRYDRIGNAFSKLMVSAGIPNGRSFSSLRNTASNLVEQRYTNQPWVVELFLSHAQPGMKSHYTSQNFDLCFEACDYLETIFRFDEIE